MTAKATNNNRANGRVESALAPSSYSDAILAVLDSDLFSIWVYSNLVTRL